MLSTQLVQFKDKQLELFIIEERHCFTAETIGAALEYSNPREAINKIFQRNQEEFEENHDYLRSQIDFAGQRREALVFFQPGVNLIGMFSKQPLAKEFRRWAKQVLAAVQQQPRDLPTPGPSPEGRSSADLVEIPLTEYVGLLKDKIAALEGEISRRPLRRKSLKPRPFTEADREQILELARQGHSQKEIARVTGRSGSVVCILINEAKTRKEL